MKRVTLVLILAMILYSNAKCGQQKTRETCDANKDAKCTWVGFECGGQTDPNDKTKKCLPQPCKGEDECHKKLGKNKKLADVKEKYRKAIEDAKEKVMEAKKVCVEKAFSDSQTLSETRKVLNAISHQNGDGTTNKEGESLSPLSDDLNKSPCEKWCKAGNSDDVDACSKGCDDAHKSMIQDGGKNRENTCAECPANKQSGFDCQLKMRPPSADMEAFKTKLADEFYGPKNKEKGSLITGGSTSDMVNNGGDNLEVLDYFKNKVGADGLLALGNFICGARQTSPDASAKVASLKEKASAEASEESTATESESN